MKSLSSNSISLNKIQSPLRDPGNLRRDARPDGSFPGPRLWTIDPQSHVVHRRCLKSDVLDRRNPEILLSS